MNDWKSGGRCFLNVLFDFKQKLLTARSISYCFHHVLLTGFKSKFRNYFRAANSVLSQLLFSFYVFREAATYDYQYTELISEPLTYYDS
jgi:hypothetical protein